MKKPESILRADNPTAGMADAVESFRFAPPLHVRRGSSNRWPAATGLIAALAVAAVGLRLSATPAVASPLRIIEALESAPAVVQRYEEYRNGRWVDGGHTYWQEGVKRRYASSHHKAFKMTRAFDGKRVWMIQYNERFATVSTEPPTAFGPERYDDLKAMLGQKPGVGERRTTRAEGSQTVIAREWDANSALAAGRSVVRIDRASARPIEALHYGLRSGKYVPLRRFTWRFPGTLPKETFEFRPPKGFDIYDADRVREIARTALKEAPTKERDGAHARYLASVYRRTNGQRRGELILAVDMPTPLPNSKGILIDAEGYRYTIGWYNALREPLTRTSVGKTMRLSPMGELDGRPLVVFSAPTETFRPPYRLVVPAIGPGPEKAYVEGAIMQLASGIDRGTFEFSNIVPVKGYGDEFGTMPKMTFPEGIKAIEIRLLSRAER